MLLLLDVISLRQSAFRRSQLADWKSKPKPIRQFISNLMSTCPNSTLNISIFPCEWGMPISDQFRGFRKMKKKILVMVALTKIPFTRAQSQTISPTFNQLNKSLIWIALVGRSFEVLELMFPNSQVYPKRFRTSICSRRELEGLSRCKSLDAHHLLDSLVHHPVQKSPMLKYIFGFRGVPMVYTPDMGP